MKIIILVFAYGLLQSQAHASEYSSAPCSKKSGFVGQTCLIKKFQSEDEFSAGDLKKIKAEAVKNPNLPWLEAFDHDETMVTDLMAAENSIKPTDRKKYNQLLIQLRLHRNPQDLIEAATLYLESNPAKTVSFNSPKKDVIEKIAGTLTPKEGSTVSYKHCTPNLEKFQKIIEDRVRCTGTSEGSENENNFYTVLAEIAACEDYGVTQIGVTEEFRTRSIRLEAPCFVKLKGASASIGGGTIEVKAHGVIHKLDWRAGHDLSGKNNSLKYWRDQLEPQIQSKFFKKSDGGVDNRKSVAPARE